MEPIKLKKIIRDPKELMELGGKIEESNNELKGYDGTQFKASIFIYPMITSSIVVVIIVIIIITCIIVMLGRRKKRENQTASS